MEKFVIQGGQPLKGDVTPSGNKNAALPILAACILTEEPVILHNVPNIRDTRTMMALLESLGATIENIKPNSGKFSCLFRMQQLHLIFLALKYVYLSVACRSHRLLAELV